MTAPEDNQNSLDDAVRSELAAKVAQMIHGTTAPLRAWGRFFLEPEWQKQDSELAAQSFAIYFVSLYDVHELAREDRLPKIAKDARDAGFGQLALSAEVLSQKSEFAARLLSLVPEDLQIVVRFFRDSVVHGPLGNYTNDKVLFKVAHNDSVRQVERSRLEFQRAMDTCIARLGSLGAALSEAATIVVGHPNWLDEIETLMVDPNELYVALKTGAIPYPWKS